MPAAKDTQTGASRRTGGFTPAEEQSARNYVTQCCDEAAELVEKYPASTMLVTFGLGLGFGVLLGAALGGMSPPRQPRWYEFPSAERFGKRVLGSIGDALPDKWSKS